jgi:two-component system, OmpR family, sensor histidine kinase TctE
MAVMARAPRFFEWLIAPLLFVWLISLGATFIAARASADSAHDVRLLAVAKILAQEWQAASSGNPLADFPSPSTRRWLDQSATTPMRVAIVKGGAGDARLVVGDEELAQASRTSAAVTNPSAMDERANIAIDGVVYRSIELGLPSNFKVLLAQNRNEDDALIRDILLFEAIPQGLILLVSGLLVAFGLAYVTKPMEALTAVLSERSASRLDPIAGDGVPRELEPFLNTVNELLSRLEISLSAQRRFIADAAHQLRTPLAALLVESQLLQRSIAGSEREAAIARLVIICERTSRLATQLLSLARAESSPTSVVFNHSDVCEVAQSVCEEAASVALAKDIDFALELKQAVWTRPADATLLGEMFRNLIDNAIKYTPRGGVVEVVVDSASQSFSVDDSGPGIAIDQRERVFAPFTRGQSLRPVTDSFGAGLGLAIAREVAQLHHAKVVIESSKLGGARVVVRFS